MVSDDSIALDVSNVPENITLSNFFDDIVMVPSSPRKEKPECF